jgi:hypothetical protein
MVLVHKIIQMQQLHMDYGRSEEDIHPPEPPADVSFQNTSLLPDFVHWTS